MANKKQDEALPLGPQQLPEVVARRVITDPAGMKAIADPLRIRIIRLMQKGAHAEPRTFTVKQLAAELDEPPTKLYRHVKLLLKMGFIQVAEVRLVGGIVEQHYRTAQAILSVNPQPGDGFDNEVVAAASAAIDEFLQRYSDALQEVRAYLHPQDALAHAPHVATAGSVSSIRIPQAKAADFAQRLDALIDEFCGFEQDETGVEANLMAVFYATE